MFTKSELENSYFLHKGLKTVERTIYPHSQFVLFSIFLYFSSALNTMNVIECRIHELMIDE